MELEIEIFRLIVFDEVDHGGHSTLDERSCISCISIIVVVAGIQNNHVFVQYHLHYLFASGITTVAKTEQFCTALVTLKCYNMFREFIFMDFSIYAVTTFCLVELLTTPSDESQSSLRS